MGTPLGECGLDNEVVSKLVVCVVAIRYLSICCLVFFPEAFIIFILTGIIKIAMERHVCNCRNLCATIQLQKHSKTCSTGAEFYSLSRNFARESGISSSRLPLPSELWMRQKSITSFTSEGEHQTISKSFCRCC